MGIRDINPGPPTSQTGDRALPEALRTKAIHAKFARPIGRYLTARGRPLVIIDSNRPIPGLVGKYFSNMAPKYFKGPDRPNFGDLAYTEAVMFGP